MTAGQQHRGTAHARRYRLGGGPGMVGRCRDLTRQALRDWFGPAGEVDNPAVQDVLLLVSEVATNAYRHGGAPYELGLDRTGGRLWVEVGDSSPVRPHPHGPHRANRASGHGLYLLERLSVGWGSVPSGTGKTVWFQVDVVPAGADASDTAVRPRRA
ncbi:ATP-binding protein [Streptomyces sp. QHH-9511]|nr:ATP-binding protein [Streptomyces sp. QHH-9511]